jgi:hypothetical protein
MIASGAADGAVAHARGFIMRARVLAIALATTALTTFGSSGASAQTIQFFAVLAGPNETPAGDTDGQGVASVMLGASGQVCFSILARLIAAPTAAHIHEGNAGVASDACRHCGSRDI